MPISGGVSSGSSSSPLGYVSDRYYLGSENCATASNSTAALAVNSVSYFPFEIKKEATIIRIGVYCTSAKANADGAFAIYTNNGGIPTDLLCDTGYFPIATVGAKEAIVSVPVTPNWYWFAGITFTTPSLATSAAFLGNNSLLGQTTISNTIQNCGTRDTLALPLLNFPTLASVNNSTFISGALAPLFWLKFQ